MSNRFEFAMFRHPISQSDNLWATAIVAIQFDKLSTWESGREAGQETWVSAGKCVDGLSGVANHTQLFPIAQPGLQK